MKKEFECEWEKEGFLFKNLIAADIFKQILEAKI